MNNSLSKFYIYLLLVSLSFAVIAFSVNGSQENKKILEVPKLTQVGNGCGPTSLDMVLRYFDTNSEENNYRNMFPSDSIGHLPKELIEFAQSRDMLVRQGSEGNIDDLVEFIDNGIPVLVLGVYKGTELKDFLSMEELNKLLSGEYSGLLTLKKYSDNNNIKSMHWMVVTGYTRDNEGEIADIYFNNPNTSNTGAEYYSVADFQNEFWNKNVIPGAKNYFLVMAKNNSPEALTIDKLLPEDNISESLKNTLTLLDNFYTSYYNLEIPGYSEKMSSKKGIPQPIYVDKDMLLFELEQGEDGNNYKFSSDYELMGGVDWIVYTIKMKPEDISSKLDLNKKAKDNRTTFPSEATDIETIFVPAKSAWRWLDFTSAVVDLVLSNLIDQSDSVELPKDKDAIYLVRAYSGGFGLQDDKEERQFVIENVDQGKDRHNNALIVNIIRGSMDAVSLVLSFADMDSSDSSNGKIVSKAVEMIQKNLLLLDTKDEMTADDLLIVINDIADYFVTEYAEKLVEEESKNTVIRAGKFLTKSADKALDTVNVFDKISKGGQIANRAFTLIYTATPLESAYMVNAELPEGEESDNWNLYKNEKYKFEIKYPNKWTLETNDDLMYSYYDFRVSLYNNEVREKTEAASKKLGGSEWSPYRNGIDIYIADNESSIDGFVNKTYLSTDEMGSIPSELISRKNTKLPNGINAEELVFSSYGPNDTTIMFESGGSVYNIYWFCSNETINASNIKDFYKFNTEEECNQILKTFRFENVVSNKNDIDEINNDENSESNQSAKEIVKDISSWKIVHDKDYDLEFKYPPDWHFAKREFEERSYLLHSMDEDLYGEIEIYFRPVSMPNVYSSMGEYLEIITDSKFHTHVENRGQFERTNIIRESFNLNEIEALKVTYEFEGTAPIYRVFFETDSYIAEVDIGLCYNWFMEGIGKHNFIKDGVGEHKYEVSEELSYTYNEVCDQILNTFSLIK